MISYAEYKRGNKELQEFGVELISINEIDYMSEEITMSEEQTNKPVKKYRSGQITCTIWENEKEGKLYRSYVIEKSYKDKDDQWKTTNNFSKSDLQNVQAVLTSALLGEVKGE